LTRPVASLAAGRVLVVGVGGLGCPAAAAVAAAGVGHLGLVDPDRVERSNLVRQLLYTDADLGQRKVAVAAAALTRDHPRLEVALYPDRWPERTPAELLARYHVVIDATDRTATKLALHDACLTAGVAYCFGGAVGWQGQWMVVIPGETPCLRCAFGAIDGMEGRGTCADLGVLAPVVGLVGYQQALAAIRILLGKPPAPGLTTYDGRRQRTHTLALSRDPRCPACGAG